MNDAGGSTAVASSQLQSVREMLTALAHDQVFFHTLTLVGKWQGRRPCWLAPPAPFYVAARSAPAKAREMSNVKRRKAGYLTHPLIFIQVRRQPCGNRSLNQMEPLATEEIFLSAAGPSRAIITQRPFTAGLVARAARLRREVEWLGNRRCGIDFGGG